MLRSLDAFQEGYTNIARKSIKECRKELEAIRVFVVGFYRVALVSIVDCCVRHGDFLPKYQNSLVFTRLVDLLYRISPNILFLSCHGSYRNAYDDLRHVLEPVVQALYIDIGHPDSSIEVKIEILKEIEDKREYHAVRLIDELKEIVHKEKLKRKYKKLSQLIHPSYREILSMRKLVSRARVEGVVKISCEEISQIHDTLREIYDIFFCMFIACFPEFRKSIEKNPEFIMKIKEYRLELLSKTLKISP
jgi:hypothetical protein